MLIWNSRHNVQFRIDDIVRVSEGPKPPAGEHWHCDLSTVKLRDGAEFIVYTSEIDQIEERAVAVIPAAPGYAILHYAPEFGDHQSLEPVIAWHVTAYGEMIPLTISGKWDDMSRKMPIRKPGGEVLLDGEEWPSVHNFISSEDRKLQVKRDALRAASEQAAGDAGQLPAGEQ